MSLEGRGRKMLPGTRTFSDADIEQTLDECFNIYNPLADAGRIPEGLNGLVFQAIVNMVGNRQVTAPMPDLSQLRRGH